MADDFIKVLVDYDKFFTRDEFKDFEAKFKVFDENGEPKFPNDDLLKLEEQVNRVRWIVPVLADGELLKCLRAAFRLARKSRFNLNTKNIFHHNQIFFLEIDTKSEPCQRFIRDSLVNSFNKIFCDDAVQTWKLDIHVNKNISKKTK